MNNRALFMYIVLVLCIFNFSCNKNSVSQDNEETEKNIIVGFSQIGAESAWRTAHTKSVLDAAKARNIQILYNNAEQKQENQIKALRSFISYQVDAIILVPIVQDGWENVLIEAKQANIPVIIADRNISTNDETLYAGYIGTDNVQVGREAAYYLQRRYKDIEESFSIYEMRGTDSSSAAEGRSVGFRDVILKDSRFSIISSESGDFLRSLGKEVMHNWLQNNSKTDIIFSHNDSMALGIIDALEENSISPGRDIIIVSIDAEQAAVDSLIDGNLNCVIECSPYIGDDILNYVEDIIERKTVPKKIYVPEVIFEEGMDLSTLSPRGY